MTLPKDLLLGPLKNNPRQRRIFIKIDNAIRFFGKIQILKEGGVCFYPIKLDYLNFLGNKTIYKWPQKETHITFHNTGRVHIGNNNIIFDYGNFDTKKVSSEKGTRDSISNHKPQLLFKTSISNFNFLEEDIYIQESGDILLEWENADQKILFTCGIFDGKKINEALKTGNDSFGLRKIGNYKNTCMLGFGQFDDITKVKDGTKILFLVIKNFEESPISEQFKEYPYFMSVTPYTEIGQTPY